MANGRCFIVGMRVEVLITMDGDNLDTCFYTKKESALTIASASLLGGIYLANQT